MYKHMKQKLTKLKIEEDKFTILLWDFSLNLSYWLSGQKLVKVEEIWPTQMANKI
jgi:hypothetical protein